MLSNSSGGFGAVALSALLADHSFAGSYSEPAIRLPHDRPRASSVIFLYMDGGVSQMDTFDPKPRLDLEHGKPYSGRIEATQFGEVGNVYKSPFKFRQCGESGIAVSELFPYVASCVDDLCIIRSMVSKFNEHQLANFLLHTGFGQQGQPSIGAWTVYGLGSESQNLPGYLVINGGLIPSGGIDNFGSSYLPANYQATLLKPDKIPVANIRSLEPTPQLAKRKQDLLRRLDRGVMERYGELNAIESAIANYEVAYRMQASVPDLADIDQESQATKRLYGLESEYEPTRIFARQCLLARRMVERGVRFIELTCPDTDNDRWDAHGDLPKNHGDNALATDQPIAALIKDLKARGLLDETLVVWAGEFGRTPFTHRKDGREHNPFGFSIWLAGGGVRGGLVYGATDEYGYHVVENKVEIHDLHATILHLLGLDHTKLTFRFGGRDMRLTDVHGNVVRDILA